MPRGVKGSGKQPQPDQQQKQATTNQKTTDEQPVYSLEDLLLPRATVSRIAKEVLPEGTQIPKDGVTALLRSATVFINYLASEANINTVSSGRKTVSAADIQKGLESAGFGSLVPLVQKELAIHEENLGRKKARKEELKNANNQEPTGVIAGGAGHSHIDDEDADADINIGETNKRPKLEQSVETTKPYGNNGDETESEGIDDENDDQDQDMNEHGNNVDDNDEIAAGDDDNGTETEDATDKPIIDDDNDVTDTDTRTINVDDDEDEGLEDEDNEPPGAWQVKN